MGETVRRLYRSRKDRMLGGVAGGMGEFLDVDSTIIRLIFAFSIFLGGAGFVAYLLMWFIVPQEPLVEVSSVKPKVEKKAPTKKSSTKKS